MNRLILFILSLGFFYFSSADWETLGPFGGDLKCVVSPSPDDSIIYISSWGSNSSIYKSTDYGASWFKISTIPDCVYSLAIDPSNNDIIYAGTASSLYKSTDAGFTWSYISLGYYVSIYDMIIHPSSSSIVYAVGQAIMADFQMVFFRSTDAGENWSYTVPSTRGGALFCITIDRSNPDNVYAGGYCWDYGSVPIVYKTTDMGSTFIEFPVLGFDETDIKVLGIHPFIPSILYAGGLNGLYRSVDGGSSWSQTSTSENCYDLATTSADPNFIAVVTTEKVYKSTDAGISWDTCNIGLKGRYFRGIAISQLQPSLVYTVNGLGFFKSTDYGETWVDSNRNLNMFGKIFSFGVAPSNPSIIYTSFCEGYPPIPIYKTTNCGSNWISYETPMRCGNVCAIAVNPYNPNTVLCLEGTIT